MTVNMDSRIELSHRQWEPCTRQHLYTLLPWCYSMHAVWSGVEAWYTRGCCYHRLWALVTDSHSHLIAAPPPQYSFALLSHGFPNTDGDVQGTLWEGLRSGSFVVSNARLTQLKVVDLEARERWDFTIIFWTLAQWYMCLWVPAWKACDHQVSVPLLAYSLATSTQCSQRVYFVFLLFSVRCTVLFERHTWRHDCRGDGTDFN